MIDKWEPDTPIKTPGPMALAKMDSVLRAC